MPDSAIVSRGLLALWAKLPKDRSTVESFHPLICHMLDVAAVARSLWDEVLSPAARASIAAALGLPESDAGAWVAYLAGLHDIGKASPAFSGQDPAARERIATSGLVYPSLVGQAGHGLITARVLPEILQSRGLSPQVASRLSTIVGGHHGSFPNSTELASLTQSALGGEGWARARLDLAQALARLIALDSPPPSQIANTTAMYLAGLVSVADWIGSAEEYFPYAVSDSVSGRHLDLQDYADRARDNASKALKRLGWTGWQPSPVPFGFHDLFPGLRDRSMRPMQEEVVGLAGELRGPSLVIVEAPMGEGKTEAAMYLADRWSTTEGWRGCYFALPTRATSDQMFSRVHDFLASRYPEDVVNLQLLHGHAALSAEFQELRQHGDRLFQPVSLAEDETTKPDTGVVAAGWFTHRKRGLLAPFGVGTIDQALLAALQTRHVFVRLFGLAHKTVIVDEVHAYDTYMARLLDRLLEWLAALGCSVVLLSATLPRGRRDALLDAYRRGLGANEAEDAITHQPYPRLSWATASGTGTRHVAASTEMSRAVAIRWLDVGLQRQEEEAFVLGEQLQKALRDGGCAAVICNTVARAQRVYRALQPYFPGVADDGAPELDLLHSRYLFQDRDSREKRTLVRFGRPGGSVMVGDHQCRPVQRPKRAVLVSTQIVEQSLDLDFDLMVSDLAPVDLLLQRSGRLWRHQRPRPSEVKQPELWICQPEVSEEGVPSFDRGSERVYDAHVLLRSWLALQGKDSVRVPDDVEELIEAVYDRRAYPEALSQPLRERWETTLVEHDREIASDEEEARSRWLKRPTFGGAVWRLTEDPREEDEPGFHRAHQALTRLSEPTVDVAFLYGSAERPTLMADGRGPINPLEVPSVALAREILARSLSVSNKRVVFDLIQQAPPEGWRRSPLLRNHRLLPLDAENCAVVGKYRLRLDDELGLVISEL